MNKMNKKHFQTRAWIFFAYVLACLFLFFYLASFSFGLIFRRYIIQKLISLYRQTIFSASNYKCIEILYISVIARWTESQRAITEIYRISICQYISNWPLRKSSVYIGNTIMTLLTLIFLVSFLCLTCYALTPFLI